MPGRKEPYKAARIRKSIYMPLLELIEREGYVGGFSGYVEGLCKRYGKGMIVDREQVEHEIREQIYSELAADGLIIPAESRTRHDAERKTG